MKTLATAMAICLSAVSLVTADEPVKPVRGEDLIITPAQVPGLFVHNLFQSGMVLQRDKPIRVWGWSDAGDAVIVTLGSESATANAGEDGRWEVVLPAMAAHRDGLAMTVKGKASELKFENILIGDVWVLGGQSNMEFPIHKVENGMLEIVSANYPEIRLLTIPSEANGNPKPNFPRLYQWSDWSKQHFRNGFWDVCSPETVGEMSAIGYVFGRRVHMASGVPIGLIDASVGGTTVEAWTPLDTIRAIDDPEVKEMLAEWDGKVAAWDPGKRPGSSPRGDRNFPGNCYLGLIAPLKGIEVRGALFHQGYNNCFSGSKGIRVYAKVFPEMIRCWRETFNDPSLPFGILSLCTEGPAQNEDNYLEMMANVGPELREVQYRTFLDLQKAGDKAIGYASTFDLRRRWYHPQLKIPAGERIARWALNTVYGKKLTWEPARIEKVAAEGDSLMLTFNTAVAAIDDGSGVMLGFAIAGEDRHFQPAEASYLVTGKDEKGRPVENRSVVVLRSPLVAKPAYYRYAWGRNPLANVQLPGNSDVPLATQRNDRWDMLEVPIAADAKNDRQRAGQIREALQEDDRKRRVHEAQKALEIE